MSDVMDILIVGGGMVGLTLAKALSDTGLTLGVIDTQVPSASPTAQELLRVSAISRSSQNILRRLNCWNDTLLHNACAYDRMAITDHTATGQVGFDAAKIGEPDLGHIIPNADIRQALWSSLENNKKVQLLAPMKPESAHWDDKGMAITIAGVGEYRSKLAIAADGANSWLRTQSCISVDSAPYDQTAIVANISLEVAHGHCARQRFLIQGPLALLPLADQYSCSIVWSTEPEHAKQLLAMDTPVFDEALQQAFGDTLGQIRLSSERLSFPLIRRHAKNYISDGLALMGDAAHTIHPLAGQGVNLGLLDAATLAQVIKQALANKLPLGSAQSLRPYERWRRSENQLMLDAMASLKTLYGIQQPIFSKLRSLGMNAINESGPVKSHLIQRAMGLVGDLPDLAKPIMADI